MEIATIIVSMICMYVLFLCIENAVNKFRKKLIYVVDDNPIDAYLIEKSLDIENSRVLFFDNAEQAIRKITLKKPDIVITDYYLNSYMTGADLIRFCDSLDIDSVLITGETSEIAGIKKERVLIKSGGKDFFDALKDWTKLNLV